MKQFDKNFTLQEAEGYWLLLGKMSIFSNEYASDRNLNNSRIIIYSKNIFLQAF